jgi:hypothetical protein
MVPDRGRRLPFVDQAGTFMGLPQDQGRIQLRELSQLRLQVEVYKRDSLLLPRRGLSTSLRALDEDTAGVLQPVA